MKTLQFSLLGLVFALAFVFQVQAQSGSSCSTVLATGCVGDCNLTSFAGSSGGGATLNYTVVGHKGNSPICLTSLGGNLCGLISAYADVTVNGTTVLQDVNITGAGDGDSFHARNGDQVVVSVRISTDPRIYCIVQGSFSYQLSD